MFDTPSFSNACSACLECYHPLSMTPCCSFVPPNHKREGSLDRWDPNEPEASHKVTNNPSKRSAKTLSSPPSTPNKTPSGVHHCAFRAPILIFSSVSATNDLGFLGRGRDRWFVVVVNDTRDGPSLVAPASRCICSPS